jgi:hypothetical protein
VKSQNIVGERFVIKKTPGRDVAILLKRLSVSFPETQSHDKEVWLSFSIVCGHFLKQVGADITMTKCK